MSNSAVVKNENIQFANSHFLPILNVLGAIPVAFIATASLLYMMYLLVHNDYPVMVPTPLPVIPEVIAEIPETIETLKEELPVKPVEQTPPPVIRNIEPANVDADPGFNILDPVVVGKPPIDDGFGVGGQMVPFIKIAPQYPQNAAAKGIEGYVDVMFDVTALGTTENIRILAYVPSSIFNKSVVKAIKGWKYKPNIVDGVPVKTFDVKDRVRFTMEK